jgi:hypothetical protein
VGHLSWPSGLHLRGSLSYAALDLPLTLRNNVLPQFGQALSVDEHEQRALGHSGAPYARLR